MMMTTVLDMDMMPMVLDNGHDDDDDSLNHGHDDGLGHGDDGINAHLRLGNG